MSKDRRARKRQRKLYGDLANLQWVKDIMPTPHDSYDKYGGESLPHSPVSPQTSLPLTSTTTNYDIGRVRIVAGDQIVMERYVTTAYRDWWDVAAAVYPPVEGVMTVPVDRVAFKESTVGFNPCTYDATSAYLEHQHGRKLDSSDREYAKYHPLSTDGGVPQEYTATVIQDMVAPYGLKVSRIRLRAGTLAMGDDTAKWMQALGCNPYGMVDHTTTNAQAIDRMRADGVPEQYLPTLEQANTRWRMEFHEDPLRPSIVGVSGYQGSTATGQGYGHAHYLAPRAEVGNWRVSVQLAPADQVRYGQEPPTVPYVRRRGKADFIVSDINGPDGQPVAVMRYGRYVSPTATTEPYGSYQVKPMVPNAPNGVPDEEQLLCSECGDVYAIDAMMEGMLMCHDCYADLWEGYSCPDCRTLFDNATAPEYNPFHNDDPANPQFECVVGTCTCNISLKHHDPTRATFKRSIELYEAYINELWQDHT